MNVYSVALAVLLHVVLGDISEAFKNDSSNMLRIVCRVWLILHRYMSTLPEVCM